MALIDFFQVVKGMSKKMKEKRVKKTEGGTENVFVVTFRSSSTVVSKLFFVFFSKILRGMSKI
jgi:hypothetical protein